MLLTCHWVLNIHDFISSVFVTLKIQLNQFSFVYLHVLFRLVDLHHLTTPRPKQERQNGNKYCVDNKCYTPTEFALFGIGAIIMGCMVGVVGISWFKSSCLPDEKGDLQNVDRDLGVHTKILKANNYYPDLPSSKRSISLGQRWQWD